MIYSWDTGSAYIFELTNNTIEPMRIWTVANTLSIVHQLRDIRERDCMMLRDCCR